MRALGPRVSPISVMPVTDLPEPDSPTTATTSPRLTVEGDAVDGLDDAFVGGEADLQVVDGKQCVAHQSLILGSSTA